MNAAHTTYMLAFVKEGGFASKAFGALKGVGRFGVSMPLWMGGSMAAEHILGSTPEVKTVVVPRSKYLAMKRQQEGGGAPQQNPSGRTAMDQFPRQGPSMAGTGGVESRAYRGMGGFGG